jgi:hypothetical protein
MRANYEQVLEAITNAATSRTCNSIKILRAWRVQQQLVRFFELRFNFCRAAGLGLPTLVNLSSSPRTFCRVLSISS